MVYGGGGITPDIHVESDIKLSKSVSAFITSPDRLLFNFSEKIKNEELSKIEVYNPKNFITNYRLSNENKDQLKVILKDLDNEFKDNDFNEDWEFIENRIKAQIANSIWGKSTMYKVNLYKANLQDRVLIIKIIYFPSGH